LYATSYADAISVLVCKYSVLLSQQKPFLPATHKPLKQRNRNNERDLLEIFVDNE